jgi:hypothetical protein
MNHLEEILAAYKLATRVGRYHNDRTVDLDEPVSRLA